MSPLEVAVIRIVEPVLILIATRFCGRVTAVTIVLVVMGLSIAPSLFTVEEDRHARGIQAVLVIACALLGVSMRVARRGVRRRNRARVSSR